ncbi:MAG: hypothetical protein ACOYK8_03055 [Alphaproteobacteria bacterium]
MPNKNPVVPKAFQKHRYTTASCLLSYQTRIATLHAMQEKLQLAGNELLRMEDEGGIALNEKQSQKVHVFFKANKRLQRVLSFLLLRRPPSHPAHHLTQEDKHHA